jgi:hypothetical protein
MRPVVHQHSIFGTSALVKTSEIVEEKKISLYLQALYTFDGEAGLRNETL